MFRYKEEEKEGGDKRTGGMELEMRKRQDGRGKDGVEIGWVKCGDLKTGLIDAGRHSTIDAGDMLLTQEAVRSGWVHAEVTGRFCRGETRC